MLFVPASREKLLQKTTTLAADSYIFDLEDAVAPDKKEKARDKLCQFLQSAVHADRTTLAVRINSLATPWGYDDLKGVAKMRQHIDALVLPKVESDVQVWSSHGFACVCHALVAPGVQRPLTYRPNRYSRP